MVDLRNRAVELGPEQLEPGYLGNPETWLSNLLIKNNSSASNQCGRKPDAMFLFARVHHRDFVSRLIGCMDAPYSIKPRKRKWHKDENYTDPHINTDAVCRGTRIHTGDGSACC